MKLMLKLVRVKQRYQKLTLRVVKPLQYLKLKRLVVQLRVQKKRLSNLKVKLMNLQMRH